jgi:hypothetical protein
MRKRARRGGQKKRKKEKWEELDLDAMVEMTAFCLKELRETKVILRIIIKSKIGNNEQSIGLMLIENDELISIFMKSVATATQNKKTS